MSTALVKSAPGTSSVRVSTRVEAPGRAVSAGVVCPQIVGARARPGIGRRGRVVLGDDHRQTAGGSAADGDEHQPSYAAHALRHCIGRAAYSRDPSPGNSVIVLRSRDPDALKNSPITVDNPARPG